MNVEIFNVSKIAIGSMGPMGFVAQAYQILRVLASTGLYLIYIYIYIFSCLYNNIARSINILFCFYW